MDIELFYKEIGEDLQEVEDTLGLPEEFIEKYLTKFYEDKNFVKLTDAMANMNVKEIEISAHTLKGNAINLGFQKFTASTKAIVDAVRAGEQGQLGELFAQAKLDYNQLIHAYEHAKG